jgi:exopolysaccharide biosynthesis protein
MKKKQYWKIILVALVDIVLAALCVGVVVLFHYVLPQVEEDAGTRLSSAYRTHEQQFTLPGSENETTENSEVTTGSDATGGSETTADSETTEGSEESTTKSAGGGHHGSGSGSNSGGKVNTKNTGTSEISADTSSTLDLDSKQATELATEKSDSYNISITKYEVGSGDDKVTYYAADIYVSNVQVLQNGFAEDSYGKNIRENPDEIAERNNAIFAISGDFYGNSETGVVIRDGILYRQNVNDADICVLYQNGTMETYSPEEFDADAVLAQNPWQAWNFGPALLDSDGNVPDTFRTTSYLNKENPRCAIGYIAPGHYMMVVVDGRDEGYSRGVTITELAEIMKNLGCMRAYNLDGGKSAVMYYDGSFVNQVLDGGRSISDIIYIEEE